MAQNHSVSQHRPVTPVVIVRVGARWLATASDRNEGIPKCAGCSVWERGSSASGLQRPAAAPGGQLPALLNGNGCTWDPSDRRGVKEL